MAGSSVDRGLAVSDILRAANLSTAAYEVQLMRAKSPPGLDQEKSQHRKLILTAALQIIEDERDAVMDDFVYRWSRYRGTDLATEEQTG